MTDDEFEVSSGDQASTTNSPIQPAPQHQEPEVIITTPPEGNSGQEKPEAPEPDHAPENAGAADGLGKPEEEEVEEPAEG